VWRPLVQKGAPMGLSVGLWELVKRAFQGGLRPERSCGAQTDRIEAGGPSTAGELPGRAAKGGLLAWRRRTAPEAVAAREGSARLFELVDRLECHFEEQDRRAGELSRHVEQITGLLERLAESGARQQEGLNAVAESVGQVRQHTALMSESLGQLPPLFQSEAEALRQMVRQMDVAQESATQLMHSLQRLSQAVDALQAAGLAQVQTLERLSQAERQQQQALFLLVREQSRRFLIIIVIAAVLGLGALAALSAALLLRGTG
jgi:hypothetical protein